MKFNNIRLLVNNFDRCFAFYNDTLGLQCTWGKAGDNYASFNAGYESVLTLFSADLMRKTINSADAAINENSSDKLAIILQVDNVDKTYQKLQDKGVKFLTEPKDMTAWGIRVTHFRDPENNLIELFQDLP